MLETVLRAIKFAVAEAGQLDRAAHVARIRDGRGELIDALVAARDERGGNQRHAAADEIDRNQIEAFAFIGGKLAEKCAEQIGKRRGGVDAFVPAEERLFDGRFHDRRAHHGNGRVRMRVEKIANERFGEALRERVGVGPAELVRARGAGVGKRLAQPADAILANLIFERGAAADLSRHVPSSGPDGEVRP